MIQLSLTKYRIAVLLDVACVGGKTYILSCHHSCIPSTCSLPDSLLLAYIGPDVGSRMHACLSVPRPSS